MPGRQRVGSAADVSGPRAQKRTQGALPAVRAPAAPPGASTDASAAQPGRQTDASATESSRPTTRAAASAGGGGCAGRQTDAGATAGRMGAGGASGSGSQPDGQTGPDGFSGATLVICPLVAVIQWSGEIMKYTEPGTLKVRAQRAQGSRSGLLLAGRGGC
jgi:hypothetical protein